MAYEYLSVGTQRLTDQGYLLPTNSQYAFRIFHVSAVGSTNNAQLVLSKVSAGTTATDVTTTYITVPLTSSGTNITGEWENSTGRLIDGVVLVNSCAGFSYAVVEYVAIKK